MKNASAAVILGLFALLGARASAAETPAVLPAPAEAHQTTEEKAVQDYGDENKTCREWTDGCVICMRSSGDALAACSLPGIACQAHDVQCKSQVEPPSPQK